MFGKSDDSKDKDSKNSSSSSTVSGEPKDTKTGTSPPNSGGRRRLSKASQLIASAKNTLTPSSFSVNSSTTEEQKSSFRVLPPKEIEENTTSGNSAGDSKPGPRNTFRVGVTEDRNRKCRRTMEDTHSYIYNFLSEPSSNNGSSSSTSSGSTGEAAEIVDSDNGYFAIFDGHAGTYAADWCGRKLHLVLEEVIRKHSDRQIPELLDMTFTQCDAHLEKLPISTSGCTAVCAVLRWEDRDIPIDSSSNRNSIVSASGASTEAGKSGMRKERQRILYTANVGDARIVLCRGGRGLRLSYDHKGSDENEGKRVANAGGLILNNRVNGILAVTRALGDSYIKELVTGHPYTTESVLSAETDEFIILACDGLWDVCTDQEAVDLIRDIYDPQEASKILVDHALSRFSSDNLSCMVVRLDWSGKFEKLNKQEDGAVSSESLESIAEDRPKEESSSSSIDGEKGKAAAGPAAATSTAATTTSTGTQLQNLPDLIPPAKSGPVELNLDQSKLLNKRHDEPQQKSLAPAPAATETVKTETPPEPAQAKVVQETVESLKKDSVSSPMPTTTAKGMEKRNESGKEELQKRS